VRALRFAAWNVNSVRSRMDQLVSWLVRAQPDVLCMQETKVEDELFPHAGLAEAGYHAVVFGQRTYNGVAIATKLGVDVEDVQRNLDLGDARGSAGAEVQCRMIAGTVHGVRFVDVYVPNGQAVGSSAYEYKLAWMDRLRTYLEAEHTPGRELVVCGDFNVAPDAIDVYDPGRWENNVLFSPIERAALKRVMGAGLIDLYRHVHPTEKGQYTWWDYRMSGFRKNRGLRIDLALATPALAARCSAATIDKGPRGLERPSDHAPIVFELAETA
jgi:exodeoxyribonuclease-3